MYKIGQKYFNFSDKFLFEQKKKVFKNSKLFSKTVTKPKFSFLDFLILV